MAGKDFDPNQPRDDHGRWTEGERGLEDAQHDAPLIHMVSDIEGFTKHGINRTIERGIAPHNLLDAVKNPIRIEPQANGTIRYIGGQQLLFSIPPVRSLPPGGSE